MFWTVLVNVNVGSSLRERKVCECVTVRRPGRVGDCRNAKLSLFVFVLVWVYFEHERFESGFRDLKFVCQSFTTRDLFHQQNRKGKIVMIKASRYMELVLGSFLAPEIDLIFGDGGGTSVVRGPYCQLGVGLCDVDAFRAAEEGAWVGLKPGLQGGTRFNLLSVQFWTPVQRTRVSKRGQKVDPLEIKSGPLEDPVLAPSLWQICWNVCFKLKLISPAQLRLESWTGEAKVLSACFLLRFEDKKRAPSCLAPISMALRPSRPARSLPRGVFCSNLHGLATLEFETCVESKLFVLLQFSIPVRPRGLPWGRPFAPAAA